MKSGAIDAAGGATTTDLEPSDLVAAAPRKASLEGDEGSHASNAGEGAVEKMLHSIIHRLPENAAKDAEAEADQVNGEKVNLFPTRQPGTMVQEVPMFVPRVEVHEVIKEIPRIEVEWVETIVEVPQIQYVDKYDEVQQIQYVPRHVPKIEVIEVPREVIRHVPQIEIKTVEKIVNVPNGERIPVPRPYGVTTQFVVPRFFDRKVPVIMSQQVIPEITETDEVLEVDAARYVPYLVPVDVYVPKPVQVPTVDKGIISQREQPVTNVDPVLLRQLTAELNPHLQQLESYNRSQNEVFLQLVQQSQEQALASRLEPPPPTTLPMTKYEPSGSRSKHNHPQHSAAAERMNLASQQQMQDFMAQKGPQASGLHSMVPRAPNSKQGVSSKKGSVCASAHASRRSSSVRSYAVVTPRLA